jgi:hypothetical protein
VTSLAERYLLLGLRLGKHVDGLVDGYFGPKALAAAVEAEEPTDAGDLLEEARTLLTEVEESDLDPQRRRWLSGQLEGLACVAEMAGGVDVPWAEAVRRCYGIEIQLTPEAQFEAAHERLDAALPGSGDVAARLKRWNDSQTVPADKLLPVFDALVDELRGRTRRIVELPEGERLDAELVEGRPWAAYNWYRGDLRSRIEINTDLPLRSFFAVILAAHEGYPGHHTEHVCKEALLTRDLGRLETSILLIHTPECLVSEGIAQLALERALGDAWAERAEQILRPLGVPFDADVARVVVDVYRDFEDVDVNVAFSTSEYGWTRDEAVDYHRRWALSEDQRARKAVEFDTHPIWGVYVPTYSRGYRLARAFAESSDDAFRRLLTEQLTTADLLEGSAERV